MQVQPQFALGFLCKNAPDGGKNQRNVWVLSGLRRQSPVSQNTGFEWPVIARGRKEPVVLSGAWTVMNFDRVKLGLVSAVASAAAFSLVFCAPARADEANWAGFYAGVHGGGGWAKPDGGSAELTGGVAGGQIGYNWQTGNTVFGFEADASWSGLEDEMNQKLFGFNVNVKFSQDLIATTRIRFGYTQGQFLYYATIGAAYSEINLDLTVTGPGVNETESSRADIGGVIGGGGVEWAMDQRWSLRGEVLVSRMGRHFDVSDGLTDIYGRAAINYRF